MAFRETIHLLINVDERGATTNVGRLRTELANTDGAFNKLKVGAAGAFDMLKQHAASAALAAGTALSTFAVKAVGDFQDVALGAGQLRDSLGVTAEEASRLQEVAGDLGIPVAALESTIGRMNRTAASTPDKFDAIGASIKRNADGTTNVTETFLSTVDALNRIPDATQRAKAAQEIFGRSWQDISELVAAGADGVREAMASVEEQKVFDDGEITRARKFRDALDELKGVGESVSIMVGAALVPALTDLAGYAKQATDLIEDIEDAVPSDFRLGDLGGGPIPSRDDWGSLADAAVRLGLAKVKQAEGTEDAAEAAGVESEAIQQLIADLTTVARVTAAKTQADEEAAEAAKKLDERLMAEADRLREVADAARANVDAGFALRDAQRDAADAAANVDKVMANEESTLQDLAEALDQSSKAALDVADAQVRQATEANRAAGVTLTATQKSDIFNRSLLDQAATLKGPARQALVDHIAQLNGIDPVVATEILALIDQGKVAEAESRLNSTSRTRTATMNADANTAQAESSLNWTARQRNVYLRAVSVGNFVGPGIHTGTPAFQGGGVAMVGEHGPELAFLPGGTKVTSQSETKRELAAAMGGGGGVTNVTVVMPPGSSGRDVVRQLRRHARYNGPASNPFPT